VFNVAKDDKKSKGEASKASKDLKDKKSSPAKKNLQRHRLFQNLQKRKTRKKMPNRRSL